MANDTQKFDYLDEHLPYMLKMLRYTFGKMREQQHYLSWNAHFESFAIHARNLVTFLVNKDTGNFKAHEFVKDYKARTQEIGHLIQKLDQQVFHLAKARPREAIGKFSSENAEPVKVWIEENFSDFLTMLPRDMRKLFNEKKADSAEDEGVFVTVGPTGPGTPSACTAGPIVNANHTTSEVKFHIVGFPNENDPNNKK